MFKSQTTLWTFFYFISIGESFKLLIVKIYFNLSIKETKSGSMHTKSLLKKIKYCVLNGSIKKQLESSNNKNFIANNKS